jgi:mannose/cellobiose epimerase-like protein (N-acyl-D-glucosamine 2-epimerase family)
MTRFPELQHTLVPLVAWTKKQALPFWGSVGVDEVRGGFHERVDLQGRPVLKVPKRLMVQGRQLYVYSSAAILSWYPDGQGLAERCVEYVVRAFYRADGKPGWIHALASDGSIANPMRDTYAHAFLLFGLASYYKLSGDSQVLAIIDDTLAFVDDQLKSPHGGYLDALPPPDAIRRQNPHMHLFEAYLALYGATGLSKYLSSAAKIFELFSQRFFQPNNGTLCEYLTEELEPMPGATGCIVEPGHHYEWIWLLRQYQQMSGHEVKTYTAALYDFADQYGWDREGFIIDEVDISGRAINRSRRAWPHTEGLKANIVEGEHGRMGCDRRAAQCVSRLLQFVGRPMPGGWMDRLSVDGTYLSDFIPASTLYHVFCAVTEAVRATTTRASA